MLIFGIKLKKLKRNIFNFFPNVWGGYRAYERAAPDKKHQCEQNMWNCQELVLGNMCGTYISTPVEIRYNTQRRQCFRKSHWTVTRLHPLVPLRYVAATSWKQAVHFNIKEETTRESGKFVDLSCNISAPECYGTVQLLLTMHYDCLRRPQASLLLTIFNP